MTIVLLDVALSRDGQVAILVHSFEGEWYAVSGRATGATLASVRVAVRAALVELQVIRSSELRTFWNLPNQELRWPELFDAAFPEIAMAGIGEHLDNAPQPV